MRRGVTAGFFCVIVAAFVGLTGCAGEKQTQPDFLARRRAIVAKRRSDAARKRKPLAARSSRGYSYSRESSFRPRGRPLGQDENRPGLSPEEERKSWVPDRASPKTEVGRAAE